MSRRSLRSTAEWPDDPWPLWELIDLAARRGAILGMFQAERVQRIPPNLLDGINLLTQDAIDRYRREGREVITEVMVHPLRGLLTILMVTAPVRPPARTAHRLTVPQLYTGEPIPIRTLDALDRYEDLFRAEPVVRSVLGWPGGRAALDADLNATRAQLVDYLLRAANVLWRRYTGLEPLWWFFELQPYPRDMRTRHGHQNAAGFCTGPFCLAYRAKPGVMLRTWFHEIGHAMHATPHTHEGEVAAFFVEHLLWRKLHVELPDLALEGDDLSSPPEAHVFSEAEDEALFHLAAGRTPLDVYRYGVSAHPELTWMREGFVPGTEHDV